MARCGVRGVRRMINRVRLNAGVLGVLVVLVTLVLFLIVQFQTRQEAFRRAEQYYLEQQPIIQSNAKGWRLNRYFEIPVASEDSTWEELITLRLHRMASLYRTEKRDDFKVEKDKCEMNFFLQRNNIPHVKMIGPWRTKESFLKGLRETMKATKEDGWPLFMKCCHLTQGSSKATIPLFSESKVESDWAILEKWVDAKWVFRADDHTRPWRDDGNVLTNDLVPGFFLQGPGMMKFDPQVGESHIFEVKVEVFWGRAYIATCPDTRQFDSSSYVTRQNGGQIEYYPHKFSNMFKAPSVLPRDSPYYWIIDEGHMECAWTLAEQVARLMAVDTVRIDIFLNPNDARKCIVNENSLSSGMGYGPHFKWIAKLWGAPHVHKTYETFDSDVPIHKIEKPTEFQAGFSEILELRLKEH